LAYILGVTRAYLHAFPERVLTDKEQHEWNDLLEKHRQGVPTAYLTGHKEFWSLDLLVTPDTLIPRSETELLVECILSKQHSPIQRVADLGTGSGAIALALAHEKPHWQIDATDISHAALEVAKSNAVHLNLNHVKFYQGDWFSALPAALFDVIVSNPPYIADGDPYLQETVLHYEPRSALISAENGLKDLEYIIETAPGYLKEEGWLFLEHGFQQGETVRRIFLKKGYNSVSTQHDLAGLDRVTFGQREKVEARE
jgi:release factor glutamine methyltransferase